jgi:2-methylaconitate cis-trans-isomerase PrpF
VRNDRCVLFIQVLAFKIKYLLVLLNLTAYSTGSPDPDGRQIDGLGGGVSSLSKAVIVSRSGSYLSKLARDFKKPLPGLDWLDDLNRVRAISDVVYRFGQVSIKEESVDWGSTCGNMVAAAAHFALGARVVRYQRATQDLPPAEEVSLSNDKGKYSVKLRLLAHDSGKVVVARVPVITRLMYKNQETRWVLDTEGDCRIAGVPGTGPGIIIESPLEGSVLSTGNEKDTIEVDGEQVDVTVIDTGLPVVFVSAKALGIPLSSLLEHPATIDANTELMAKLEKIRQKACTLTPQLQSILSSPSPKICVVHPSCDYTTTGGEAISQGDMDVVARTVSSGQLHRTIPATTLSALAASLAFQDSIVAQVASNTTSQQTKDTIRDFQDVAGNIRAITVGQPAGCSSASVTLSADGQPTSILMMRTARRIMEGSLEIPSSLRLDAKMRNLFQTRSNHSSGAALDQRARQATSGKTSSDQDCLVNDWIEDLRYTR